MLLVGFTNVGTQTKKLMSALSNIPIFFLSLWQFLKSFLLVVFPQSLPTQCRHAPLKFDISLSGRLLHLLLTLLFLFGGVSWSSNARQFLFFFLTLYSSFLGKTVGGCFFTCLSRKLALPE